jgi:hypothetical protein
MNARDNISWCQQQIDNATDTLASIAGGARTFINGEEITESIAAKRTSIIADMKALIGAYSQWPR